MSIQTENLQSPLDILDQPSIPSNFTSLAEKMLVANWTTHIASQDSITFFSTTDPEKRLSLVCKNNEIKLVLPCMMTDDCFGVRFKDLSQVETYLDTYLGSFAKV